LPTFQLPAATIYLENGTAASSDTSVITYQTKNCYNLEDDNLYLHLHNNLRSYTTVHCPYRCALCNCNVKTYVVPLY